MNYKEWYDILFPPPPPEPPKSPIHFPYFMGNGLWGITGLRYDVETSHETYEAAKRSADALNVRAAGGGPRQRRRRR